MLRKIINITLYLIAAFVAFMAIAMIFAANVNNFKAFVVLIISAAVFLPEVQASINRMVGKNINAIAYIFLGFVLFICGILIAAGTESQVKEVQAKKAIDAKQVVVGREQEIKKKEQIEKEKAEKVKEQDLSKVIYPYTKEEYPKLYAQWGEEWISDINLMLPKAAEKISKESKCDNVEIVEISTTKSKPKQEAVFFIDCSNGERFYVSQNDFDIESEMLAESEKLGQPSNYIHSCRKAITAQLQYPSSFDDEILSISARKTRTGNIEIVIPFTAKNGLGMDIPQSGRCLVTTENKIELNITDR